MGTIMTNPDDPHSPHPPLGTARPITARASGLIAVPRDRFIAWFAAVALEKILPAYGPIAATTHATPIRGVWNDPGARRRVHQADGSSAVEEILTRAPDGNFTYIVWGFKWPLGALAHHAQGEFSFSETPQGATMVTWRYNFAPSSIVARPFLLLLVKRAFQPFMQAAIAQTKAVAEHEAQH